MATIFTGQEIVGQDHHDPKRTYDVVLCACCKQPVSLRVAYIDPYVNTGEELDQAAREAEAATAFEARVQQTIEAGAKDRETAIRWLFDAENDPYVFGDPDYYCHSHGLPYGYSQEGGLLDCSGGVKYTPPLYIQHITKDHHVPQHHLAHPSWHIRRHTQSRIGIR